jgi:hypothetical protein
MCFMPALQYFFILGCPRSGTTMLQQALNRHSQIIIPAETKYFFSFLGHCGACQHRHLQRINADLGIDLPLPGGAVKTLSDARSFYSQMAYRYQERLGRKQIVYFGEKTPEHTGFVPQIRQCFPKAKFVLIYRDGRDVALSMTKVPWMHNDLYVSFAVWLYYYYHQVQIRRDHSLNLYCIKYEDLVVSPLSELRALTDFLGLPFEPALADGYGNREGVPQREYPWKSRALERISQDRIGMWRRELPLDKVRVLERFGGGALQSLGYDLVAHGKTALPFLFLPELLWNLALFGSRLPFQAVVNQFLGRAMCFH